MNAENFEKWIQEHLLPNIPPQSVIVLDNAPYHSKILDKVPTRYSTKPTMLAWLQKNNIVHDSRSRKADLIEIINQHKPQEKIYRADATLQAHGHIVLRLPPYMCDLNPIELAWAAVKR